MAGVEREFDIVITSNSGYPLDQNLYQAVKGMDAASARIVRQDGAILLLPECRGDGLPDHGEYAAPAQGRRVAGGCAGDGIR